MNTPSLFKIFSLLVIFLTPQAAATYYYNSEDIQQRIISEANRQNITPSLALAIAKVESNFNPNALSYAGAKGVMQIMPRTAEQAFGVPRERLFEPDVNIKIGVKFIKQLLERYNNRLDIALSHYNGGSGVKNSQGELRVMPATQGYVDKVLGTQQEFLQHDKPMPFVSGVRQSPIQARYADTEIAQTDLEIFEPPSQNPQVETLRALRLHNITRNYQDKRKLTANNKVVHVKNSQLDNVSRQSKMAKVRQWESIYLD
ncbi:lytic transglycosylase domain-containing protein [uncultured Paraglaciecola sp.]|uniref:lytic transglycosylase domain-containing protein n=1 Tax=uncultured Paraglaciecola sp. TaxID=1765024 RepID=UPI0030DD459E|tara:strand:- start:65976 stop:66749 length:774 start_codon:yes stop_codon:yes gene_type:complete